MNGLYSAAMGRILKLRGINIWYKRGNRPLIMFGFVLVFLFLLSYLTSDSCSGEKCNGNVPYITTFQQNHWRNTTKKRILRWTGFFSDKTWEGIDDRLFRRCKVQSCTMTNDRSLLDDSDAILIHVGALWKVVGALDLPQSRLPFQRWIIYNVEPPPRTPIGFGQLAGLFNWTSFYRLDSDVPVFYGGYVRHNRVPYATNVSGKNFAARNYQLAAWMSSNCYDFGRRRLFINDMKQRLPEFDLYGKCGGTRCPETICREVLSRYKFFFAIENSLCRDYVTEKFWAALERRQIPIVRGNIDYAKIAPPHSFINADDFGSGKDLSDFLLRLSRNEDEYNKYLKWTERYDVYGEIEARREYFCDLCEALHDKSRPTQVYSNLDGWYNDELETCPQWMLGNQISRFIDGIKITLGLM
ncbi:alpha-(1,3)-fucosyltransferase 7 [Patella vulgata]|uniref:alpha-(1,3)-fucosyltransferase 7 n=1 Tax=Patella vulgata TaxID=6465 RepID=UPI00217F7C6D|nr:alpha-(1,3)-fucosyltransferase 7 [Patella vulgata]